MSSNKKYIINCSLIRIGTVESMSYLHNNRSSVGSFEESGSSIGDEETLTPHEAYEIETPRPVYPSYGQQQQEDYVSQPSVSQPLASSTAIFWTQKRKLIAGISSVALVVVAAVVGVSASSKSSSANQRPLIEDVVITDDVGEAPPSIAEDTTEPVAVELAPELITTEIVDDGIIYDFVAQQEVSEEEPKIDLDIVEFKGDLSDFIDADVARFSIDASDEDCNSLGALWEFEIRTDKYPWETKWRLYRSDEESEKELWVHGPPEKATYNRLTNFRGKLCIPAGDYEMEISDSEGDGYCCQYGFGGYTIKVGGFVVGESNMEEDDPFDKRTYTFKVKPKDKETTTTTTTTTATTTTSATTTTVATEESAETEPSTQDSTEDPTESPSSEPSVTPTQVPSSSPSLKPTPLPTPEPTEKPTPEVVSSDPTNCSNPNVIVGIEILTDGYGKQTGFTFTDGSGVIKKKRETGTMLSDEKYLDEICISPGTYELNMEDTKGNGIRFPGNVAVHLGGRKILHDFTFNERTRSYTIQAGFNPVLDSTESEWLDGHNLRRKEFHEANGKEFRPLTWSPEMAQGASDWAGKIVTDGCVLSREQDVDYGELTFAMITSNGNAVRTQPEKILKRWYDSKIDPTVSSLVNDSETPGLAFSQVVLHSSRYLGCAKQVGQIPDGKYCHVVLCR